MAKKLTQEERIIKIHEQRFAMIMILCNILESPDGVSNKIKSAVAASLINIMDKSMISKDDTALKNLINNAIDIFCAQIEVEKGIENYRDSLLESIEQAKQMVSVMKEKMNRIADGDNILKGICLN
jgi:hypothetical protein